MVGHVCNMLTNLLLTSMEQPSRDPLSRALMMIRWRSPGAFFRSYISATPPVKSSKPSVVLPPDKASYEPLNLKTHKKHPEHHDENTPLQLKEYERWVICHWVSSVNWVASDCSCHVTECLTWRRPSPAERSRTRCLRPSGRTSARRLSPADDHRSPRPPTPRTARTTQQRQTRG